MTKILAFFDGSAYAEDVCRLSAWTSTSGRRCSTSIPASTSAGKTRPGQGPRLAGERQDDDRRRSHQKGGDQDSPWRPPGGLADLEKDAQLGVIGKRGEAADFAKLHLGSNLERVVQASTRPVLVAARAHRPFERFIIAFDGGRSANRAD